MTNFDKCLSCRHICRDFAVVAVGSYNQDNAMPFG
jgi:hypothetical protein